MIKILKGRDDRKQWIKYDNYRMIMYVGDNLGCITQSLGYATYYITHHVIPHIYSAIDGTRGT